MSNRLARWWRNPRRWERAWARLTRSTRGPESTIRDALIQEVTHDGERVTHLRPDRDYIAHLSIYHFARRYCGGKRVLDAGSGAGYGSEYLARNGAARVQGIELSDVAIEFSKRYFGDRRNLSYRQMDVCKIQGFPEKSFDVIFSSNVLEHVPDVFAFLDSTVELLRDDGLLIVAVPPIQNSPSHLQSVIDNLNIPWHLNIWTMRQWGRLLAQYYGEVQLFQHSPTTAAFTSTDPAEHASLTVEDFAFEELPSYEAELIPTMTAIFVAKRPRAGVQRGSRALVDRSFYVDPPSAKVLYASGGILASDVLYPTNTHVDGLPPGIQFCQGFRADRNGLCGIAVFVAAFGKPIRAKLRLSVMDESATIVRTVQQKLDGIPDNSYCPFSFEDIPDSKGRGFRFCVEALEIDEGAITIWTDNTARGVCTRNGEGYDGALCFKRCFRD